MDCRGHDEYSERMTGSTFENQPWWTKQPSKYGVLYLFVPGRLTPSLLIYHHPLLPLEGEKSATFPPLGGAFCCDRDHRRYRAIGRSRQMFFPPPKPSRVRQGPVNIVESDMFFALWVCGESERAALLGSNEWLPPMLRGCKGCFLEGHPLQCQYQCRSCNVDSVTSGSSAPPPPTVREWPGANILCNAYCCTHLLQSFSGR